MATLTGNTRYRVNWRGKLILQLEWKYQELPRFCWEWVWRSYWRDAKLEDLKLLLPEKPDERPEAAL